MSNNPRDARFSADVLDNLQMNEGSPHQARNIQEKELEPYESSVLPPSFDSFPDLTAPSTAPAFNIPSFSSFPDISSSLPASPTAAVIASKMDYHKHLTGPKSKSQKKSKKERGAHDRHHGKVSDKEAEDLRKRLTDDDDRDRRRKDRRSGRTRSKSRERSPQNQKEYSVRDRDYDRDHSRRHGSESNPDRHRSSGLRSSKRRESSRERHSDRTHDDRFRRREDHRSHDGDSQDRSRLSSQSGKREAGHSRGESKSPDYKRSRRDDEPKKDRQGSSRRDWDLKRDSEGDKWSSSPGSSMQPRNKVAEKEKPGSWIVDVHGDRDFFRYGGINPLTVPKYNRAGGGRVLGMPSNMRIDYEKTRAQGGKVLVFRTNGKGAKSTRYIDPHATWRDKSQEYKRISRAKAEEFARSLSLAREDPSFISLDIRSGTRLASTRKNGSEGSDSGSNDDRIHRVGRKKKVDYRDIHGKSVYKEEDADLLQTTSDQEEEGSESTLDVLMRRRMMLDAELRKDPQDPDKWLEFIAMEDEIDLVTSRRSAVRVAAHSAGHLEVKLSIFERALQSNPTSEQLLLEYMNTCRQCWEPAKVLSKWDELLQSAKIQSAWPGLWIEYLDFRQRHFLSFSVKSFARALEDALDRLGQLAKSTWMAIQRAPVENAELMLQLVKVESVMVHTTARAWTFFKQAGYIERAQGIIQGQMEFLFNMPPSLKTEPWKIQIGSLEEYWDSELPRFGEKDAKGWNHYVTEEEEVTMENQLDSVKLPSSSAPTNELIKAFADNDVDRYHYTRWAKLEKEISSLCWFPIRTTEDLPDQLADDPYGIIIFDDIRPFIMSLHSPEARQQYVDCMFNFLGLPMNSLTGSNVLLSSGSSLTNASSFPSRAVYNPFFHDGLLLNLNMDIQLAFDANIGLKRFFPAFEGRAKLVERIMREIERDQELQETEERDWSCVWDIPLRLFPNGPNEIFGRNDGRTRTNVDKPQYPWATIISNEEIQGSNKTFIRNTFQQLTEVVPLSKTHRRALSLYHLMYETLDTLSASKSQKLAKKYLKGDRMDLDLWNAYAQAEKSLGRISEARKVYSTVIAMYQSFPAEVQAGMPLIYRHFAELEWEQDRPNVALAILVAFAEGIAAIPEDTLANVPLPSPTRLIKARQFYSQKVAQLNLRRPPAAKASTDTAVGCEWFKSSLDLIVCFAWFEYLSTARERRGGLQSAVKVFEDVIEQLDFGNPECEIDVPVHIIETDKRRQQTLLYSSLTVSADILKAEKKTKKKKICTGVETEAVWIQLAKLVYAHSLYMLSASKRSTSFTLGRDDSAGHAGGAAGFQPRDLRNVVQAGLERFPNCTILQSLFFWTEAKQRLHGRVRTWVNEQVMRGVRSQGIGGGGTGPVASKAPLWIFGLFYELWNQEPYNPSMVRSILESALESSQTSSSFGSSPNLWLIYIEFEMRESARQRESLSESLVKTSNSKKKDGRSDKENEKQPPSVVDKGVENSPRVKQLLMRALSDCPWYKDLYILAFESRMRGLFSLDELDQLYQTMLEKGIRVRIDFPEREPPSVQTLVKQQQEKDNEEEQDVEMKDED
ncbi:hypothetical protein EDD11_003170 [Mortierella claussenii]|nr:hypothetical protein EDD11_003170 [Mortierella claussenii]